MNSSLQWEDKKTNGCTIENYTTYKKTKQCKLKHVVENHYSSTGLTKIFHILKM